MVSNFVALTIINLYLIYTVTWSTDAPTGRLYIFVLFQPFQFIIILSEIIFASVATPQ